MTPQGEFIILNFKFLIKNYLFSEVEILPKILIS